MDRNDQQPPSPNRAAILPQILYTSNHIFCQSEFAFILGQNQCDSIANAR